MREKVSEVKKLYRKAMKPLQRKERNYVVMKKNYGGKLPKDKKKGPTKMVDKRLKKDARAKKRVEKRNAGKGNGRKKR